MQKTSEVVKADSLENPGKETATAPSQIQNSAVVKAVSPENAGPKITTQNLTEVVKDDSPESPGQDLPCQPFPYFGPPMAGNLSITKTWDNRPIGHEPALIGLSPCGPVILIEIDAPYFGDPAPPNGKRGKPYKKLWEHEVVEAFFLGEDEKYLELEFNPHGQHLILLLNGKKKAIKMCLPVYYISSIGIRRWQAVAKVPKAYFPPNVNMVNAYAIHGTGENRVYEAMSPVPTGQFHRPDFHRLEFFQHYDFSALQLKNNPLSPVWKNALDPPSTAVKSENKALDPENKALKPENEAVKQEPETKELEPASKDLKPASEALGPAEEEMELACPQD